MAPRAHEQPAAGMGRREESSRRAEAYRANDERAARGTPDTGAPRDAGGCRWQEAPEPCRLDVLRAFSWTDWHYGGDGGLFAGKEKN